MNKGAAEAMGFKSVATDVGHAFNTGVSGALRFVNRRGVGTTRHIETQELWLQNATRNHELEVQKVSGEENVADMNTKIVRSEELEKQMEEIGFINQPDWTEQPSTSQYSTEEQRERCATRAVAAAAAAVERPFNSDTVKFDELVEASGGQRVMLGATCGAHGIAMFCDYQRIPHYGSSNAGTGRFGYLRDLQNRLVRLAGAQQKRSGMMSSHCFYTTSNEALRFHGNKLW